MNKHIVLSGKIGESSIVEDYIKSENNYIALSDGAGGYGILADRWAKYLVDNISAKPMTNFEDIEKWLERIWKPFFDENEIFIKESNSFVKNKFYNEGSCATLAVMWKRGCKIKWITFGDSSFFLYNKKTNEMFMSLKDVSTYDQNPNLLNWKTLPIRKGFTAGNVNIDADTIAFIASDALSCYLTISYYVTNNETIDVPSFSRLNTFINSIKSNEHKNFFTDILKPLMDSIKANDFHNWLSGKLSNKEIGIDDYSFGWIEGDVTTAKKSRNTQLKGKSKIKK